MKGVFLTILTLGIGYGVGYVKGRINAKVEFYESMIKASSEVEKEEPNVWEWYKSYETTEQEP